MLKVTISASILQALSTSALTVMATVGIQKQVHPLLIEQKEIKVKNYIKWFNLTPEAAAAKVKEEDIKESSSIFENLPLISNITAFTKKSFEVSRTETDVTLTVKEEFALDAIKIVTDMTVGVVKPLLDVCSVFSKYVKDIDAMAEKWEEDVQEETAEEEITLESKTIPESEVPADIASQVHSSGWLCKLDDMPSKAVPFFTDEEKENYIPLVDLRWTRGNESFVTSPPTTHNIFKNKGDLKQIAEFYGFPVSLLNELYAHYGVELPVAKETPAVEVIAEENQQPAE